MSSIPLSHHLAPHLVLGLDNPVGRGVKLLVAIEERQADNKDVLEGLAARHLDELAGAGRGSTGSDEVAARQRPFLNFKKTRTRQQ